MDNTLKAKNKTKTFSLSEDTINTLEKSLVYYDKIPLMPGCNASYKVDEIIPSFYSIIDLSLKEISNLFTKEDLDIIFNACNMLVASSPEVSAALIIHNVVVFYSEQNHIILPDELEDKILHLTSAQAAALQLAIKSYWYDSNKIIIDSLSKEIE